MEDLPMPDAQNAPAADTTAKHPDQKAALTPPTSEDMEDRGKRERSSSELSELELDDEEDIGDIEPDHYWDGGKIPVFKPVRHAPPTSAPQLQLHGSIPVAVARDRHAPSFVCDLWLTGCCRPWTSFGASRSSSIRLISTA